MVFQQRNGRIDRYGQKKKPDIRYMVIESNNKRIKGDVRILEILVQKEEQALKNIGDPSLLMGKFTIEDEELVVASAIENGSDEKFSKELDEKEEDFDPFKAFMESADEEEQAADQTSTTVDDMTLFSDKDYMSQALSFLNQSVSHPVEELQTVSGLDVKLTEEMKRRLRALVPEEALPEGETLRLSDDKSFCMEEMKRSMQNDMANTAWPKTQYLWPLHPLFSWINDKSGLLFGRGQAPLVALPGKLAKDELIYVISGSIPNRKSTPLVDEWFGIMYEHGAFLKIMDMDEVLSRTGIRAPSLTNPDLEVAETKERAEALLQDVVVHAKAYLKEKYQDYQDKMNPLLNEELDKLADLQKRHHQYYQITLADYARKLEEKERGVDELFEEFTNWVTDTLTIQDNPYIRVITVFSGAEQ